MIKIDTGNTNKIDIDANDNYVDLYFIDDTSNISIIEMSRYGAELLLTRLLEALNKIERRV